MSISYPSDSVFGRRLNEQQPMKKIVAEEVVRRFLPAGVAAFIGDGSSPHYVGQQLNGSMPK